MGRGRIAFCNAESLQAVQFWQQPNTAGLGVFYQLLGFNKARFVELVVTIALVRKLTQSGYIAWLFLKFG